MDREEQTEVANMGSKKVKVLNFIADVTIEKAIIDYLKEDGYDVKWISDFDCKMKDKDLLHLANKEKRIRLRLIKKLPVYF